MVEDMRGKKFNAVVIILTFGIAISGCAQSDPSYPPGPTSAIETPSIKEETPEPTSTPDPEPAKPATQAECLIGDWIGDVKIFYNRMQEMSGGELVDMSGDVLMNFAADGTTKTTYNEWTLYFVTDGLEVTISRDGIDTGTFSVKDDKYVSLVDTNIGSTLILTSVVSSVKIPGELDSMADIPFTCTDSELTLDLEMGEKTIMTRVA